ncbi:drebrin-like protein [Arachis ipaensis]|uniref:drebrin-like protein n=1 Tax=Arachis ipaensis TaxID=130454 RepID=UPI000A2B0B54|nr:drebrin-like protein [Arachis ipaensis]
MSKTQQAATPKSEVQIVEFQQQTRSEPLEIPPLALSLPSSVQEELMKDDFIYVPPQEETQQTSNNDCPQEAEKQGVIISLTSSIIEDLMKDDYVYEVSNEEPAKEQEQQAQEPTVQQESQQEAPVNVPLEQPCEEPTEQQSKQEAPVDVCPPEPNKQGVTGSITSSVIEQFFKDAGVYQVSDEEQSKEPPVARQSEKETLILSSFDRYVTCFSLISFLFNIISVHC